MSCTWLSVVLLRNTIFTNVALLRKGGVVGRHDRRASCRIPLDWQGNIWTPDIPGKPAPRRPIPMRVSRLRHRSAPTIDGPPGEDPTGVPISAIIFGGRRCHHHPRLLPGFQLERRSLCWGHHELGDDSAAAAGEVGEVRRDPMAMLPFCGYHMADYFRHWIKMQRSLSRTPRIFHVNWFRRHGGQFCLARISRQHASAEMDRGPRPRPLPGQGNAHRMDSALRRHDWKGLDFPKEKFEKLQAVDRAAWKSEVIGHEELLRAS